MAEALKARLQDDLKTAMKAGDTTRRDTIRLLISEVKKKEIDVHRDLEYAEELQLLQQQAKQRKESIEQFEAAGRDDLVAKEQGQLEIIESYLPQQMTDDELRDFIEDGVTKTDAKGPKDMGKLMGLLSKSTDGRVEGRRLADEVKKRLTQFATDPGPDPDKVGDATNL